jgi:hypothetical protein
VQVGQVGSLDRCAQVAQDGEAMKGNLNQFRDQEGREKKHLRKINLTFGQKCINVCGVFARFLSIADNVSCAKQKTTPRQPAHLVNLVICHTIQTRVAELKVGGIHLSSQIEKL